MLIQEYFDRKNKLESEDIKQIMDGMNISVNLCDNYLSTDNNNNYKSKDIFRSKNTKNNNSETSFFANTQQKEKSLNSKHLNEDYTSQIKNAKSYKSNEILWSFVEILETHRKS